MTDAYVAFADRLVRPVYDTPINGINDTLNEKLSPASPTTDESSAAPENTTLVLVTFASGAGFVAIGDTPTATTSDRYVPEGVPTIFECHEGDKVSVLDVV